MASAENPADASSAQAETDTLLAALGGAIWEFDADAAAFTSVSEAALALIGAPPDAWRAPGFWAAHIHPDDRAVAVAARHQALHDARPHVLEYRVVDVRGEVHWLRDAAAPAVPGCARRWRGAWLDITEQHAAVQAGVEHVRFLECLDAVNRAIQGADDPEALVGCVLSTLLDAFDADRALLAARTDEAGTWVVVEEHCRPDHPGAGPGHVIPGLESTFQRARAAGSAIRVGVEGAADVGDETRTRHRVQAALGVALTPAGHGPYVLALHFCRPGAAWGRGQERLLEEIGRRLSDALTVSRARRALRHSEHYLAQAQRLTQLGHWERDFERGTHEVSAEAARVLGLSAAEIEQNALPQRDAQWRARIHPDDVAKVRQAMDRALAGIQPYDVEYRIVRPPDGQIRYVRSSGELSRNAAGRPARWFGTLQDVTDRRQAEQAARDSHALLRAVFDGTTDAIAVKDLQGRFLMVNRAFADLRDATVDDLVGTIEMRTGVTGLSAEELAVLTTGEPRTVETTVVVRGGPRTLQTLSVPYFDAAGTPIGVIDVARDVTDRRYLEQELRDAQKMEAVGRLAGGVAHHFNNALTVILGYAEMVGLGLPPGDPNLAAVEQIVQGAERAASITRQLMAFSRTQPVTPRVIDVGLALRDLHALLRPLIAEDIEMTMHLDEGLGAVLMDQGLFEQAITNLVVNASDAMPDGGRLRVEAVNAVIDGPDAEAGMAGPGAYVEVRVWDSGRGMDDATRGRIFEPFFTTKTAIAGAGLGLSMVYGFVTQLGGHIDVTTRPGKGSLFRLLLPRSPEPAPVADGLAAATPARGHETILLVEDEDAVRRVARLVLESRGYRVLEARDGVQALEVADAQRGRIDLLVSDLVMPRMNGQQLAERLALAYPSVKVLLMSGYPGRVLPTGVATDPRVEFLSKPFQPSTLARRVRECLDRGLAPWARS